VYRAAPLVAGPARSARALAKAGIAQALTWTRGDALLSALTARAPWPLVLGYHRVVEDFVEAARAAIPALLTSRAMLEQQLDWVGRRFRFVTLDELGEALERGHRVDRMAAVTFDDGYRDLYDVAFPVLRRKGIPAAVFVVTELVGSARPLIHDRLNTLLHRAFAGWREPTAGLAHVLAGLGLRRPAMDLLVVGASPAAAGSLLLRELTRDDVDQVAAALEARVGGAERTDDGGLPLTWAMLAEMRREGITVGSHTRTHAWLTREGPDRVRVELEGSRLDIERHLGGPARHLAYPDGHFDAATVDAAARAGYRFGYTTCRHRDARRPLLTIPRRLLWEQACLGPRGRFAGAVMSCQVHGVFDLVGDCGQDHRR
jgi:peptidoglycan/xylan/chitin deacetylase (PgdA/CDA1 family)